MTALSVLALSGVALLALVIGYALGRATARREVREARRDAMAFVRAKQIAHMSPEDIVREFAE
jgi:multisubunit Na+/H+ antiporter MnhG subunit